MRAAAAAAVADDNDVAFISSRNAVTRHRIHPLTVAGVYAPSRPIDGA